LITMPAPSLPVPEAHAHPATLFSLHLTGGPPGWGVLPLGFQFLDS
jgi:hypothetical protein